MAFLPEKYLIVGKTCQNYTVSFNNQKVVTLTYDKPFEKVPQVQLTMADVGLAPPYKTAVSTTQCVIKFQLVWTGTVDVQVTERL